MSSVLVRDHRREQVPRRTDGGPLHHAMLEVMDLARPLTEIAGMVLRERGKGVGRFGQELEDVELVVSQDPEVTHECIRPQ